MNLFTNGFRQALRGIATHRAAFALPTLLLAAGLGLAIAMACVIDVVLLRALPYPNAERVVQVNEIDGNGRSMDLTGPNVTDLSDGVAMFEKATHYGDGDATIAIPGQIMRSHVAFVGGDFFGVLGQAPRLGRALDARTGATSAVIGHALWQGLLQGRADVLGSGISIDGSDYTIVGVMPPGFGFPHDSAAWVGVDATMLGWSRSAHNWSMLALLASGDGLVQARLEASALAARLLAAHGETMDARGFAIVPLAEVIAAPVRTALGVLLAGVLFLLAIAVTNAMNLQLSLAIRREREFAVRAALEGSGGVCLRWTHAVDGLIVEIVDGGPGLPPSENLFVPFFTTKPGGSGIGLVLARQIAEAHGGRVTLENRADAKGCLARLWLPA